MMLRTIGVVFALVLTLTSSKACPADGKDTSSSGTSGSSQEAGRPPVQPCAMIVLTGCGGCTLQPITEKKVVADGNTLKLVVTWGAPCIPDDRCLLHLFIEATSAHNDRGMHTATPVDGKCHIEPNVGRPTLPFSVGVGYTVGRAQVMSGMGKVELSCPPVAGECRVI